MDKKTHKNKQKKTQLTSTFTFLITKEIKHHLYLALVLPHRPPQVATKRTQIHLCAQHIHKLTFLHPLLTHFLLLFCYCLTTTSSWKAFWPWFPFCLVSLHTFALPPIFSIFFYHSTELFLMSNKHLFESSSRSPWNQWLFISHTSV